MKKLEWAANKLKKLKIFDGDGLDLLRHHGFSKKYISNCSSDYIYIHKKRGIVVKNNYRPNGNFHRTGSKYIVKTIMYTDLDNGDCGISIQPYCKAFRHWTHAEKAVDFLYSKPWLRGMDIHTGNVRLYRGKPVLIDW